MNQLFPPIKRIC